MTPSPLLLTFHGVDWSTPTSRLLKWPETRGVSQKNKRRECQPIEGKAAVLGKQDWARCISTLGPETRGSQMMLFEQVLKHVTGPNPDQAHPNSRSPSTLRPASPQGCCRLAKPQHDGRVFDFGPYPSKEDLRDHVCCSIHLLNLHSTSNSDAPQVWQAQNIINQYSTRQMWHVRNCLVVAPVVLTCTLVVQDPIGFVTIPSNPNYPGLEVKYPSHHYPIPSCLTEKIERRDGF